MKSNRWHILVAALLITGSEVLVFQNGLPQVPQQQANGEAPADASGMRLP